MNSTFNTPSDPYSLWLRELVDLMTFNCEEEREKIESVLKDCPRNQPATGRLLAEYQIQKIQKDIRSDQKTLAVFYPSKAYRENLGSEDLYERIRAQGYNVIFLFGVIRDDEFEKRSFSYYAGHDLVGLFNFIDAFIYPTLMDGLPFASKKILFVHDIYDSPKGVAEAPSPIAADGRPQRVSPLLDELDYTFLPCKTLMPPTNKLKLIRQKPLCRIPGGYIKLDKNIEYFKSIHTPIDSIIFAPTVHWDHFYDYVAVPEHGRDIVAALLERFSEYKIIFRPHPHTVDTPEVQKIAEAFKGYPQFEFDTNASFYMENYARSQLMITDMSGTAFTYAFTTSRPVVFFSHKDDNLEEVFGEIRYFKDREKIGYVATNIQELLGKVSCILENKSELEQKIGKFRDESIYNVGKAEDYIVENIRFIMENETHPDWQYVESPIVPQEKPESTASLPPILMEEAVTPNFHTMNARNSHTNNLMPKLQIGDLKHIRSLIEKNKAPKIHKRAHPLKNLYPRDQLSLPEIIQIEPIHACNLRCTMCHVGLGEKLSYKKIEVKQLLRNLGGLGPIWYDIGSTHEPTMHPDFVELAVGLTRLGGNISTVTNATLLTAKKRAGLDEANIKKLTVSFDGCTKETYESIRLRANYESALNNIEGLVSQLNGTDTYFSISNTIQKENLDEIEQCVDFWNEFNFNHINYLAMVVREDDARLISSSIEDKIPELELRLNNAATKVIENQLDITLSSPVFGKLVPAKSRYPDNFVTARDFHYVISDSESAMPPFAPMPFFQSGPYPGMPIDCSSPFKMARIDYSGNVVLCHKIVIGNIYEKPFEDIWYSEEANTVRAYVQTEDTLCNSCNFFKFCINCSEVDYSNKDNFRNANADNFRNSRIRPSSKVES